MSKKIERIGVLTSGGDAPGMNACVRAVVRTCIYENVAVTGIYHGYQGMYEGNFMEMDSRSVSNIIHLGGTILKTARSKDFLEKEGRQRAFENLQSAGIDALVAIGGDGTLRGAEIFSREFEIPVIGIPGTIDNDLYGSDFTLGYDTATNTVIEAIDKIRDTAASHNRLFFVEVMGRDSGCIALHTGIAGGAEAILLPEKPMDIDQLCNLLEDGAKNKKSSTIVIVAEGEENGGAYNVAKMVKERFDYYETKVTILGHLQRGGTPSSFDRVLASRFGYAAVKALLSGQNRQIVGLRGNRIEFTSLEEALNNKEFKLSDDMLAITEVLAI